MPRDSRSNPDPGLSALRRRLRGGTLSPDESTLADAAEVAIGAPRPLSAYAGRTQRRYLAGEEKRLAENQARRISRWGRVNPALGLRADFYDKGTLSAYQDIFGPDLVERLLADQARAARAYARGDHTAATAAYRSSTFELAELTGEEAEYLRMLDPLRYYHVRA